MERENPFPKTKPLKEEDVRRHSKCACCQRLIGQTGSPMFYLVTVERHIIRHDSLARQDALETLCGSPSVARALSPNEDFTSPLMERGAVMICEECSTSDICVAQMAEYVNKATVGKEGSSEKD